LEGIKPMENQCYLCGITNVTIYFKTIIAKSGETADVFVCESCYWKIDKKTGWIEENIHRLKNIKLLF